MACQKDRSLDLSVNGRVTIRVDPAEIKEVWSEGFKTCFPDDPTDPRIAPIRIDPIDVESSDTSGVKKFECLWQITSSYVSGTTPDIREGEQHGILQP